MTVLLDVGKLQIKDSGFISGFDYCNINKFWVVTSSVLFFYLKTGFCRIVQTSLELIILSLPECTTIPGFISIFLVYLSKLKCSSMIDYKWGIVVHKTKQEKKSVAIRLYLTELQKFKFFIFPSAFSFFLPHFLFTSATSFISSPYLSLPFTPLPIALWACTQ